MQEKIANFFCKVTVFSQRGKDVSEGILLVRIFEVFRGDAGGCFPPEILDNLCYL